MIYNLALLGCPVTQSLSPIIHSQFFQESGLKGGYICIDTKSEYLNDNIKSIQRLGFRGVNLTIPHKQIALEMANIISDEAKLIGATNTLIFEKDGIIRAENTDYLGFINSLSKTVKGKIKDKKAIIIGAGGSARAIFVALLKLEVKEIILLIRETKSSLENAQKIIFSISQSLLMKNASCKIILLNSTELKNNLYQANLIVNTTPLGMIGKNEGQSPLEIIHQEIIANPNCHFYDLIYNPAQTEFLKIAQTHGFSVQNGMKMLYNQATESFFLWTNYKAKPYQNKI